MQADRRVLVPITYGFSVRYLLPTGVLSGLAQVCHPVIALGWDDPELHALLEHKGFEVLQLPLAQLSHEYRMFRRKQSILHDRRLNSPTTKIRRARQLSMMHSPRDRAVSQLRSALDAVAVSLPRAAERLALGEPEQLVRGTNLQVFEEFLKTLNLDAVLSITPYHDQDGLLLCAAQQLGLPSLTSVISFDNPTTRERMLVCSDQVLVWNQYNQNELVRSYPQLEDERVSVIGAPQFDLHRKAELRLSRDEWCRALSLPEDRPIILYGAGPAHLVPGEASLIRLLDDAIEAGSFPQQPYLLVRRHPTEPAEAWSELSGELRHGHVVDPWAAGNSSFRGWPSQEDIIIQMSSLAHATVHINVCSSMTLDGAMFDRPQIGPTFVPGATRRENSRVADMYQQEHWQPITASGGLTTVGDAEALLTATAQALEHPEVGSEARQRMIQELLTFTDGQSSQRLVDAVAALPA
jgi:hypothetical protein